MRALILATSAAALLAAPAFADSDSTASYTLFIAEDCDFGDATATVDLTVGAGGDIADSTVDAVVECNTPFTIAATDGDASGTANQVTMAHVGPAPSTDGDEYETQFVASVAETTTDIDEAAVGGKYPAQDGTFTYTIDWSAGAAKVGGAGAKTGGLAAGNYIGALFIEIKGDDVTDATP